MMEKVVPPTYEKLKMDAGLTRVTKSHSNTTQVLKEKSLGTLGSWPGCEEDHTAFLGVSVTVTIEGLGPLSRESPDSW
jgi:hypothetical protein